MIVINSAAYVVPEFRTEFGKIPPCLLPIGNKKLLEYQVKQLRLNLDDEIIVSLPADYEMTVEEISLFQNLDVRAVHVPSDISLAEAILFVINTSNENSTTLKLLHGDTFLESFPTELDCIAVATSADDYNWEADKNVIGEEVVWCGYFAFALPKVFIRCLALSRGDFVGAVRAYTEQLSVKRVQAQGWHDLGHVNTYFKSRSQITTQRIFNDLRIRDGIVWKSGQQRDKIKAESEWFKALPPQLKKYAPQLIDSGVDRETGNNFYSLEYLPMSPLNEVFVHGRNPAIFWDRIFSLSVDFMAAAREAFSALADSSVIDLIVLDTTQLVQEKTYSRLEEYATASQLDIDISTGYGKNELPSFRKIAEHCIELTLALPTIPTILHGDLCLSNILYDSRSSAIKIIDPRGINQNLEQTIFGDQKYDLAKLAHSILGLYDFIISGRYTIQEIEDQYPTLEFGIDDRIESIQLAFLRYEFVPNASVQAIMPLTILLFLSMLPLHTDNPRRQQAMLLNALRLYDSFLNEQNLASQMRS